jgi:hypothetical protein
MSGNAALLREALMQNCSQVTRYLGMDQAQVNLLREASQAVLARSEEIIGEILGEVFRDPESARILQDAGLTREVLEGMLRSWLAMAFQGDYGEGMCLEVSRIGLTFAAHGLAPGFVLAKLATVTEVISRYVPANPVFPVVLKALRWNLTVVMLGYEVTRQWLFERVLGVNEKVYKRLQALAVKGILEELGVARSR